MLISASENEKAAALEVVHAVRGFFAARVGPKPLLCDSGNGYHLLYRINLPADDGGIIRSNVLATRFDTDKAKVDKSVFNAARICKLPGTMVRKGDDMPTRPHREWRYCGMLTWP